MTSHKAYSDRLFAALSKSHEFEYSAGHQKEEGVEKALAAQRTKIEAEYEDRLMAAHRHWLSNHEEPLAQHERSEIQTEAERERRTAVSEALAEQKSQLETKHKKALESQKSRLDAEHNRTLRQLIAAGVGNSKDTTVVTSASKHGEFQGQGNTNTGEQLQESRLPQDSDSDFEPLRKRKRITAGAHDKSPRPTQTETTSEIATRQKGPLQSPSAPALQLEEFVENVEVFFDDSRPSQSLLDLPTPTIRQIYEYVVYVERFPKAYKPKWDARPSKNISICVRTRYDGDGSCSSKAGDRTACRTCIGKGEYCLKIEKTGPIRLLPLPQNLRSTHNPVEDGFWRTAVTNQ